MARLLLVDDDESQLKLRRLLLEHSGHEAATAQSQAEARAIFEARPPDAVLLDLRLPTAAEGCALIREWYGRTKLIVLSGAPNDLEGREEKYMVDELMQKPVRSRKLLEVLARLLLFILLAGAPQPTRADTFGFELPRSGEAIAELPLSAPGSDWAVEGREAAVAEIRVNGGTPFHAIVAGPARVHSVFLGALPAGRHRLSIERSAKHSAPGVLLEIGAPRVRVAAEPDELLIAHAPVLYARANTIGRFSDIPLLCYVERAGNRLDYTIVFSNEDGGTSTRALMARWGRTTDIELIYRVETDRDGSPQAAIVQGRGHRELVFDGERDGRHPLLIPVTDNNMVSGESRSELRFQTAPLVVDLSSGSRETVMDDHPWTYEIMAKELIRERKLRPFGSVEGSRISDLRNYGYLEAKISNRTSAIFAGVRLRNESRWRFSHLGSEAMAVERSGWIRTAIELPPGTKPEDIAEAGFGCIVTRGDDGRPAPTGACEILELKQLFFLDSVFQRVPTGIRYRGAPIAIAPGELAIIPGASNIRNASLEP